MIKLADSWKDLLVSHVGLFWAPLLLYFASLEGKCHCWIHLMMGCSHTSCRISEQKSYDEAAARSTIILLEGCGRLINNLSCKLGDNKQKTEIIPQLQGFGQDLPEVKGTKPWPVRLWDEACLSLGWEETSLPPTPTHSHWFGYSCESSMLCSNPAILVFL